MIEKNRRIINQVILDHEILMTIKENHQSKYAFREKNERVTLLEDDINKVIDHALKGINDKDINSLRRKIINGSFLMRPTEKKEINYEYVYEVIVAHYQDNHIYKDWFMKHSEKHTLVNDVLEYLQSLSFTKITQYVRWSTVTILALFFITFTHGFIVNEHTILNYPFENPETTIPIRVQAYLEDVDKVNIKIIPEAYRYKPLNKTLVKEYLEGRSSKLREDYYLDTIDELARAYYINPVLLLAITGQEQGFVPEDNEFAKEIINNPYNVFNSWRKYNTTFEDATIICLNTINTAIQSRPEDKDLIEHLNHKYSEDDYWQKGVKYFYTKLQEQKIKK